MTRLSPWIIGFILFTAGPIIASLVLSFMKWDVISEASWVGLANYKRLFSDPLLMKALGNTVYYAALSIPLHIIVALGLALLGGCVSASGPEAAARLIDDKRHAAAALAG